MEHTIWKFPIRITDQQVVSMPSGSKILCVQVQGEVGVANDNVCLWALVPKDGNARFDQRTIRVVGTGCTVPDAKLDYIGTVQTYGGQAVNHVFEER